MKTWKLIFGFLMVTLLSSAVSIGTYSYLNKKNENNVSNSSFIQPGFQSVGFAVPAENTDFTYAAEKTVNAVVHIKSVARPTDRSRGGRSSVNPFEFFFGDGNPFGQPLKGNRV